MASYSSSMYPSHYIAHPDLPATVTRVESLTSNSFKFGVQKFPWDFNSQWINSIPPGGYGITLSLRVESTVLSDITVYFGSELIADPVVEETEQEKIYTVTLVNALPLSLSDNYWELDDGAF